ncbi:uncharacterized protein ACIQIH_009465 [Cyanocitta cristata]
MAIPGKRKENLRNFSFFPAKCHGVRLWSTTFLLDAVSNIGNVFRFGIWTWTSHHPWVHNHQAMGLIQSYSFDVSNKRQHLYKQHIDKWMRQASGLEKTSASSLLMYLEDLRLEDRAHPSSRKV